MEQENPRLEKLAVSLILAFAFGLRAYSAYQGGFFEDEFFFVLSARKIFEPGAFFGLMSSETNPVLFFVFLKGLISLLGEDPFILRMPFVLIGTAGVLYSYKLAKTILPRAAIITMLLFAVHNQSILNSAFVRNYILLEWCTLALFHYALTRKEKMRLPVFGGLCFLTLTSHFTGVFPIMGILTVFWTGKFTRSFQWKITGIAALAMVPNLIQAAIVLTNGTGSLNWIPLPWSSFLWKIVSLRTSIFEEGLSSFFVLPLAFWGLRRYGNSFKAFYYSMAAALVFFFFYFLLKEKNIFYWNTISAFRISLLYFVAAGISHLLRGKIPYWTFVGSLILLTPFIYRKIHPAMYYRPDFAGLYRGLDKFAPDRPVFMAGCYQEFTMSEYYVEKFGLDHVENHLICDPDEIEPKIRPHHKELILFVDRTNVAFNEKPIDFNCPGSETIRKHAGKFWHMFIYQVSCR